MKKKTAAILLCLWIMVMLGIVVSSVTLVLSRKPSGGPRWLSEREKEMLERYERIETIRETLEEEYYQEIDGEQLMSGAINGMLAVLNDPYTLYYSPDAMRAHDQQAEGAYSGLGILLQINGDAEIEIIRVYENSPAEKAGLQTGDIIARVNGKRVSGENQQTFEEAVGLIQSDGGSAMLGIRRGEEERQIDVERGDVNISNVHCAILDGNIGYVNIFQFTGDDVEAYTAAQETLRAAEVKGLIIDLRNNPGGLLDDVTAIADELLPAGLIVYTENREGARESFYSDEEYWDIPAAVLVNDMSASASEILAAAMQDFDRAKIIGTNTYGKGVVQTLIHFDEDQAGLQYTSSCYYTPSGKSINGCGVTPDIVVDGKEDNGSGIPDLENDPCLKTAHELLCGE